MNTNRTREALLLGLFICLGLVGLGYLLSTTAMKVKAMDRIVSVKGLAEREVEANIAIWPISFNVAGNDLPLLYAEVERKAGIISAFLKNNGFSDEEITLSQPAMVDRQAQLYGDGSRVQFRFMGSITLTVYTAKVGLVRETMKKMVALGREGLAISGEGYQNSTQYIFTELNNIKPAMIEEATKNAREVALKFAKDSDSRLGKIKTAAQGQFTIEDRDSSTPHIKKVRVVSTITYYLSD
jgi:hypothetical protein